ncbi:MAG: hypothetical protein GY705_03195 [Bacteroidetes bacterium]|nr:hypothetical protein [Bacteroidota bacterium]
MSDLNYEELSDVVRRKYLDVIWLVSMHAVHNERYIDLVLKRMNNAAQKSIISKYRILPILDRYYAVKTGKSVFGLYSKEILPLNQRIEIAKIFNLEDKIKFDE